MWILDQPVECVGDLGSAVGDQPVVIMFHQVFDPRNRSRDNRTSAAPGPPRSPGGPQSEPAAAKRDGIHSREKKREVIFSFTGPYDAIRDSETVGLLLQAGFQFTVADRQDVTPGPCPSGGIEEQIETPPLSQFPDHAYQRRLNEAQFFFGPFRIRARAEVPIDRCRNRCHRPTFNNPFGAFRKTLDRRQCPSAPAADPSVEGILTEMARISECSNEGNSSMNPCDDRLKVIVRQEAHHDVGRIGESPKCPEVGLNVRRVAVLDEIGDCPVLFTNPALEVGPSYEEQPCLLAGVQECPTPVLRHSRGTGEFVRRNGEADAHRRRIAETGKRGRMKDQG